MQSVAHEAPSKEHGTTSYKRITSRKALGILVPSGALLCACVAGVLMGTYDTSVADLWAALGGDTGPKSVILLNLRAPRVIMAVLVGSGLATAGCVCQAILKNPLASPFTLGISSGAGFGAVLGIVFFRSLHHNAVAVSAFVFALASTLLIMGVSRIKGAATETLILGGVAVMFLFSSLTSFVQYTGTMEEVHDVVFWFFGSLSKAGWPHIGVAAAMVLPCIPLALRRAWDYNALLSGDEAAKALGIRVTRLRMEGILVSSLMTAGAICFVGVIGFIGLVAPHISRMLVGSDHRYLVPASALMGATLVVCADIASRVAWPPQVIPIGIMTSLMGVPFFFYLLVRTSRRYW